MPGDYSRKLFDAKKHYSAVLEQQGRVQVDADWNEQADIQQYRVSTETIDVIGATGVPKQNNGFFIVPFADGSDFTILPGRIYLDGLLFELEPGTTTYLQQPYYLNPDLSNFNIPTSPPGSPASPVKPPLKDGTYIVYVEGWQRERNFHDDPHIQEVALGEADTTTRLQNVWQVKILKVTDVISPSCATSFTEWDNTIATPTGKMNAQAVKNTSQKTPCVLPPSSGYSGLENQLYRIQIVKGGDRGVATFTWSRDNASVETNITQVFDSAVTVADIGKDDVLGFANGQWVEIVETEPTMAGGTLVQIDTIDQDLLKVTFKTAITQYAAKTGLKLRRWDVSGTGMDNGIAMTNDWITIESGVQVSFSAGTYRAGDYWLIPARTATGNIEWPVDSLQFSIPQWPSGIKRHFGKLGLLVATGGHVNFIDCRPKFPSLTGICAEDICFNNTNCNFPQATTVQQALDLLCQRSGGGSCTIVVKPGAGWESALSTLADGMDAQICFQSGLYPLANPVVLKNKGNLKMVGCGSASRIVSANAEAAIIFDHCKTVNVRDLYAEGGAVSPNQPALAVHLNGVFSFTECEAVNVDHLVLKSGASATRNCTCITISNDAATPCPVRIEDCDLQIGNLQQGILVINASNCWIERNSLKVYSAPGSGGLNRQLALGLRKLLSSNLQISKAGAPPAGSNNVTITSGNFAVNFKSDSSLQNEWKRAMDTLYPTAARSEKELQIRVQKLATRFVTDSVLQDRFRQFGVFVQAAATQTRSIASQGITVGGQVGKNLHISGNVITDVLQGIHVGVSHRTAVVQPDSVSNLSIANNTIAVTLPSTVGKLDRYGIFAGNGNNILIENNTLTLERIVANDNTDIDGIRVWGNLGFRVMVSQNMATSLDGDQKKSFSFGINVNPLQTKPATAQWVVMWNVTPGKIASTTVKAGVVYQNNT